MHFMVLSKMGIFCSMLPIIMLVVMNNMVWMNHQNILLLNEVNIFGKHGNKHFLTQIHIFCSGVDTSKKLHEVISLIFVYIGVLNLAILGGFQFITLFRKYWSLNFHKIQQFIWNISTTKQYINPSPMQSETGPVGVHNWIIFVHVTPWRRWCQGQMGDFESNIG